MRSPLLKIWKHRDGRRIAVFTTHKARYLGRPDEWPILLRSEVPHLSDDEWTAPPVEDGWSEVQLNPQPTEPTP